MNDLNMNNQNVYGGTNPEMSKKELKKMIEIYLASNPLYRTDGKTNEVEIRFGTNQSISRPYTLNDYENVVKQLYKSGFTTNNPNGTHMLRIQNEYDNEKTGLTNISKIRAELVGLDLIQEYCRTNSIQHILDLPSTIQSRHDKVKFTLKSFPVENEQIIKHVEFSDFNFRVSYQLEQDFSANSNIGKNVMKDWNNRKKMFRFINRVRFEHPTLPVFADMSIVKMNKNVKNKFGKKISIPTVTIEDAGVFQSSQIYEMEIEIDNSRVGAGTPYDTVDKVVKLIHKMVRIVLGGIQETNYPISHAEINDVLQSYIKLIHGEDKYTPRKVLNNDFIGPSSYTLQLENVIDDKNNVMSVPNIRKNYTVTDKADGDRKLLFVNDNGKIYMIDTNMKVSFTGLVTKEKSVFDSILDGEYIKHDKHENIVNLYAAFDIYFMNKLNKRNLEFVKSDETVPNDKSEYRLNLLNTCILKLNPILITNASKGGMTKENKLASSGCNFVIKCKEFYHSESIFDSCRTILTNVNDGTYLYNTDGLIFTPANAGVACKIGMNNSPLHKKEWDLSFKWKPPKYNTIDFLVSLKKDKNGNDEIHTIYTNGIQTTGNNNIIQYKTLILRCGFNEKNHGFLNPFQSIIDDEIPSFDVEEETLYRPVPFQPTNPYDQNACFANILIESNNTNEKSQMKTEEGEYFEENMIVEFKYDMSLDTQWRWIPLRVRHDKTAQLRMGESNYGNAYHVANNNWYSIHHPVTEEMISTGENIPETVNDDEIYYNMKSTNELSAFSKRTTYTSSMRNFHNLFVKKKLIMSVSNINDTLIDYAVGKAGDLSKWIDSKLKFVFGIDISKDNIYNHLDGACARYLKSHKKFRHIPSALFINGNSANNIRKGEAFTTDKEKMIANSIFGNGPKDRNKLGKGVYKNYGTAHDGFNVSSCQFALHYFFENLTTLTGFVRNLAECTAINGYFVGTCFDGETVFNLLKSKPNGDGFTVMKNDVKICEITKLYHQTGFANDENSLGLPINVFQETINKVFREYLVNFKYFSHIMENFGFVLLTEEESKLIGLPKSSGMFEILYQFMKHEIEKDYRKKYDYGDAYNMSPEERQISFMNRYFIFKKIRDVNAEKEEKLLHKHIYEESADEHKTNDNDILTLNKRPSPSNNANPKFIRKLKHKIVIKK